MGAWEQLEAIGAEQASDDVVAAFLRDPVVSYVGLAVIGAREPNPGVVVALNGTRIRLPAWTVDEWDWWARLGVSIALRVKAEAGDDDKRKIDRAAARVVAPARKVKDGDLSAPSVAALYDACVRLVIEAAATDFARKNATSFLGVVKAALLEAVRDIPPAMAEAIGRARDVITGVAKASAELLAQVFGAAVRGLGTGLGISGGALVLLVAGLWYMSRNTKGD